MEKVRSTFVDYFTEKQSHKFVKSSPVVPVADPTLLFTNAGMNQFKPMFLGTLDPQSPLADVTRACNAQKCIRAGGKHNDLDDVGVDTSHHTFFEMLGSWSFGDYFKKDAIGWAFDLLVNTYGLDPDRMYATYFGGDDTEGLPPDEEAQLLWHEFLPPDRVLPGSKKDNFWEMGDSGPCGMCSEIHYDCNLERSIAVPELVNQDDPEVLELWNLVFIEFNRDAKGILSSLPAKHVDTGMGLERLVAVLNKKKSNYDTDAFEPLFTGIHGMSSQEPYGGLVGSFDVDRRDTAYRAVADHIRCLSFAIADGAAPSNEGRGYVLRRVLRRAVRYGRQTLGITRPNFLADLAPVLASSHFGDAYPELRTNAEKITSILKDEEAAFAKTLERGVKYLDDEIDQLKDTTLPGSAAFFLYDSLGFPVDLTTLMAAERGITVDQDGFKAAMAEQVERSRADRKKQKTDSDVTFTLSPAHVAALDEQPATRSLLGDLSADAKVVGLLVVSPSSELELKETVEINEGDAVGIVLDATPFYAEGGGQVADVGQLTIGDVIVDVQDVQLFGGYVLHVGVVRSGGKVSTDSTTVAQVDAERRRKIAPNHSMTHVLNHALREVLGDHVDQKGSFCDDEKLRFDFSHSKAMTPKELEDVEERVNAAIQKNLPVDAQYVPLEEARGIPSLRAVFGEAYPDPVRVVATGCSVKEVLAAPNSDEWRQYSIELCGGTHVSSTSEAKKFAITEETAVAKGVRRLEAVTRDAALKSFEQGKALRRRVNELATSFTKKDLDDVDREAEVSEAAKGLRSLLDASRAPAAVKPKLRAKLDDVGKRVGAAQKRRRVQNVALANDMLLEAADDASENGYSAFVVQLPPGVDPKSAGTMASQLQNLYPALAFFAVSEDSPSKTLAFAAVPEAYSGNTDANTWLKLALGEVGGRGGGKPTFAQGSAPCDVTALINAAQDAMEAPPDDDDNDAPAAE